MDCKENHDSSFNVSRLCGKSTSYNGDLIILLLIEGFALVVGMHFGRQRIVPVHMEDVDDFKH